jgi:hypothetical protein
MTLFIHYFLHLLFPAIVAYYFFKKQWVKTYFIFLLSILIDFDHLLANPIYQPCRCSIGFHPLHSYLAIVFYLVLLIHPKSRIFGIGLIMHIATDSIDCLLMKLKC